MTGWRMRPTASALGVIAIVSVMITATPSGADSGAIEPIINHPEEDQHVQEDESAANQTATDDLAAVTVRALANDTASELPVTRDSRSFRVNRENDSRTNEESIVEPQRDQSDQSDAASNDVHESEHDDLEDKAQQDLVASTQQNVVEIASNSPLEVRSTDPKISEDLSNVVEDQFDDSNVMKSRKEEFARFTTATSVRETIATAELKPIEQQKSVDDIRAISFQVPAEKADDKEQDNEQSKKDLSRTINNVALISGKSTKAFYEIKPSIKTEMEGEIQQFSSTQKPLGRKFVMPSVDSAFGKFGPYFEDGDHEVNITARIGSTMLLDCKIGMLGDKKVTWVQQHSKDSFRLLTVGRIPYSVDQRISLDFRYPSNWRLQILYATPRDSGLYKCQVATHPPLVKTINVVVTAPELTITDDSGRVVPKERHLKAGSALKLRCEARDIIESLKESVVWTRGDETLTEDVSENRTTEIFAGREILVIVSTLIVERASPRHAGNYSCEVPGKAKTTIAVHVLNGELPAAVHDGNGVSRAFLNLWLIHLTMSYVFSR